MRKDAEKLVKNRKLAFFFIDQTCVTLHTYNELLFFMKVKTELIFLEKNFYRNLNLRKKFLLMTQELSMSNYIPSIYDHVNPKQQSFLFNKADQIERSLSKPLRWNCQVIEKNLLPSKRLYCINKVVDYVVQFFTIIIALLFLPLSIAVASLSLAPKFLSYMLKKKEPNLEFPNWHQMNIESLCFPMDMKFGVATSEYQDNGAINFPHCNWADWEREGKIKNSQNSGISLNHWNNIPELIQRLRELGVNSYRFSVERSVLEPQERLFNLAAMQHYAYLCDQLIANGIEPLVTLHHFTNPSWFERKGGFEKEENIASFVNFSKFVFQNLSGRVTRFATINEPAIYSFMGYVLGEFPPGKKDVNLAGEVMKNLLKAHCEVYRQLKNMRGGERADIGIVHNVLRFQPYHSWNPIEVFAADYLTRITHKALMGFFKTGKFELQIPFLANISFEDPLAPQSFDWWGINYYTDPLLHCKNCNIQSTCYPGQKMTDMPFRDYPQGLATAIKECSQLGKNIYITENGIISNDQQRETFYKRTLYILSEAVKQGIPIKGYYPWTLKDNFEWAEGWGPKFGLYSFNPLTRECLLRDSSRYYIRVIQSFRQAMQN